MDRFRAIEVLKTLRPELEARGVVHAGLFGSLARDEARANSDVDVVVTVIEHRRLDLFDLGGIQSLLDDGFRGAPVDLVVTPVRKPGLRAAIDRDRMDAF